MRAGFGLRVVLCATMVWTACDRPGNPAEAARMGVGSPRVGVGVGDRVRARIDPPDRGSEEERPSRAANDAEGASPEGTYDAAIIRIAGEHEGATDQCDALAPSPRVDCKGAADRQRDAASTSARKQRDLARR